MESVGARDRSLSSVGEVQVEDGSNRNDRKVRFVEGG